MSSGVDRSEVQPDGAHRSIATELVLRQLFIVLERRLVGLTNEVLDGVNSDIASIEPDSDAQQAFIEKMKAAAQSVLLKPLI